MEDSRKIGRYEVEKELGRGGMGKVYLARDPYMNRRVAVKVLSRPPDPEDHQLQARFEREARIIAELEHPAIVPIYDFGYHEEQPFIVMRYMLGGTLRDQIEAGRMSPEEALRIFRQIGPALDYVHSTGVVHRDLKPGNILFDRGKNAFIADFGIAKISEPTMNLTGSGIIGTPAYMSPEQVHGKDTLDGRSDIYSLGIMLFEMLTGKVPYNADTPISLALAHLLEPIPDILKEREELLWPYQKLFFQVLAKERDERIATAAELVSAMEQADQDRATQTPDPDRKWPVEMETVQYTPSTGEKKEESPEEIPETITEEGEDKQEGEEADALAPAEAPKQNLPRWILVAGGMLIVIAIVFLGTRGLNSLFPVPTATMPPPTATAAQPVPTKTIAPTRTSQPVVIPVSSPSATSAPTGTPTPTITPTPSNTPIPTMLEDAQGVPMILIPEGSFEMGSTNGNRDERPIHTVFLDNFYIDQYEVTNERYAACVTAGVCPLRNTFELETSGFEDYPVRYITWFDAQDYCEWRGAELPTEAQWEKAARGGLKGMTFPWGNELPNSLCEAGSDGGQFTNCPGAHAPVGSFAPNGYGLYDMVGNVWEWVADWYGLDYYTNSPENNPTGPESGAFKVQRGGSWTAVEEDLRNAIRFIVQPDKSSVSSGMRCVWAP